MLRLGTPLDIGFRMPASIEPEQAPICDVASVAEVWDWVREYYPDQMVLPFNMHLLEEFVGIEPQLYDFTQLNNFAICPVVGSTDVFIDRNGEIINITVNISNSLDEYHKRWVEAHIFAHFLTGHWNIEFPNGNARQITMFETTATINPNNTDPMEEEANNYALELLLPAHTIKNILSSPLPPEISYIAAAVPYEVLAKQARRQGIALCGQKGPDWVPADLQHLMRGRIQI